jgi:hypothetical protein
MVTDVFYKYAKSQCEIIYTMSYIKMTKSDKYKI